jgi:hypothetical protein
MKKPHHPSRTAFSRPADLLAGWRSQQRAALDEKERLGYDKLKSSLEKEGRGHDWGYFWSRYERASREAAKLMQEKPTPHLRMFPPERMKMYRAMQLGRDVVDRRHFAESRAMAEDHQKALDNYLRSREKQRQAAKAADRGRAEFNKSAERPAPAKDAQTRQETRDPRAGPQQAPERDDRNRQEFNARATERKAPEVKPDAKEQFNGRSDRSSAHDLHHDQEPQANHDAPAPEQSAAHDQPHQPSPAPHVPEITESLAARFNARADMGYGQERGYGHNPGGLDPGADGPSNH